jgi:hypothetical protein
MTEEIVPFQLVTLENDENVMPLVEAELNGFPIRLVVDTGASHTCLDRSAVKKCLCSTPGISGVSSEKESSFGSDTVMGLGGRRLKHAFCRVESLKFGDLVIRDYQVVAVRLSNINRMLRWIGMEPIDGLLGCDVLSRYRVQMDFENMMMRFCW